MNEIRSAIVYRVFHRTVKTNPPTLDDFMSNKAKGYPQRDAELRDPSLMSMIYEIWDYETGNCVGAYRDEASALTDVRDTVRRHGLEATASLVLLIALMMETASGSRLAQIWRG